jgi:hypothetical protein
MPKEAKAGDRAGLRRYGDIAVSAPGTCGGLNCAARIAAHS